MRDARVGISLVVVVASVGLGAPGWAQPVEPPETSEPPRETDRTAGDSAGASQVEADASAGGEPGARPWLDGVPIDRRQAARALFLQGNELISAPLFAKAAAKYKEAIALWEHPAFYYNLAIAQMNLEQPIAAYESLKKAMQYGEAPLGKSSYEQAKIYEKLLDGQLARIEITCDEPGAEVRLDGELLFTGPGRYQGMVRPGGHQVVASKAGYVPETEQVVLSPGERGRVTLALLPFDATGARRWDAWKPWAVVGAGAAVLVAGGAAHWRAAADFGDFDAGFHELSCAGQEPESEGGPVPGCDRGALPPELASVHERAELEQRLAVGAYVLGGAAVATGLVLVYLNRPRPLERPGAEQAWIVPAATGTSLGVSAGVRF